MSKAIEAIYCSGRIELPSDVRLPENTRVTVIVSEDAADDPTRDPAYTIQRWTFHEAR